jgi:hypothetical protein
MDEEELSPHKSKRKVAETKASAGKAGREKAKKPAAGKKEEEEAEEVAEASDVGMEDHEKTEDDHQVSCPAWLEYQGCIDAELIF